MMVRPKTREIVIAACAVALVGWTLAGPARADDKTDACDAAAAAQFDQDRPSAIKPVLLDKIDAAKAQAACEASVAANPTDRRQIYELGRAYLAAKDYPKAIDSFKKASDLGSAMATSDLASVHSAGLGTPKDPAAARALAEKAAAAGNALAEFDLGVMYQLGHGGPKDLAKARGLVEKAAAAGVAKAYFRLGYLDEMGAGGPADFAGAKTNYAKCIDQPVPNPDQAVCERRLGFLYETGKLGAIDAKAAFDLFQKSAALGDADSLRALGQVYAMGRGVPRDYVKARAYFEKAAAKGDPVAMRELATIYDRGLGVPRDAAKGKDWTDQSKAAEETQKALNAAEGM
jgi:TPR repeat protein